MTRQYAFAGRQVHDANIVVTMLAHDGCRLLPFNTKDFERFGAAIGWSSCNYSAGIFDRLHPDAAKVVSLRRQQEGT
jgi:hypothetical protein